MLFWRYFVLYETLSTLLYENCVWSCYLSMFLSVCKLWQSALHWKIFGSCLVFVFIYEIHWKLSSGGFHGGMQANTDTDRLGRWRLCFYRPWQFFNHKLLDNLYKISIRPYTVKGLINIYIYIQQALWTLWTRILHIFFCNDACIFALDKH